MPEKLKNFDTTNLQELFNVEAPLPATQPETSETIEQEINTSRSNEVMKTSNPEVKKSSSHVVKRTRDQEHKKPKEQVTMKPRSVIDDDGHVRSPHNITMRDDYYRELQQLALDRGSASRMWLVLDEAVGQYLESMGRLTPSGRVKR